jgi:L-amino acid N-acyltransferase YncA
VAAIYNQGIAERQATFEHEPWSAADFSAALSDPERLPFLVGEGERDVLGWARLTPFSRRACYSGVGEASIYIDRPAREGGLGLQLFAALATEAEHRGFWKIVGLLFPENEASVRLCLAAGCREVGLLRRHGRLDGQWRDVLLVELSLGHRVVGNLPTMPYIVPRRNGSWEARESTTTREGPRSRTLATFRSLTPDVVELVRERASKPLAPEEVHAAAARAGAPIAKAAHERAARDLLVELAAGRQPRPVLRRLLLAELGGEARGVSDSARSAVSWIGATLEQRGETLRDLLALTDKLPSRPRPALRFPRIDSARP